MYEVARKAEGISKTLYGKRIVGVVYKGASRVDVDFKLEVDNGSIYILLDDGTAIKAWNRERGGIEIAEGENNPLLKIIELKSNLKDFLLDLNGYLCNTIQKFLDDFKYTVHFKPTYLCYARDLLYIMLDKPESIWNEYFKEAQRHYEYVYSLEPIILEKITEKVKQTLAETVRKLKQGEVR